MDTFRCGVLLGLLLLYLPLASAEIYKWVDEKGRVHFGDRKDKKLAQEVVKPQIHASQWSRYNIDVKAEDVAISPEEIQSIRDGVNHVYEFYDRILHFDFYKTVPVNILILKDQATYYQYLTKKYGRRPTPSYDVYYPKDNQIIVYMREDRAGTFRTIRHEASHAIVDTITPYAPAWLNEGLAEQMETLKKSGSQLKIDKHAINHRQVRPQLQSNSVMGIGAFLRLPSKKWRHTLANRNGGLQAYAGEFVNFLLSTSPDRSFVMRLMHKFERGDRTISYYLVDQNYIGGIRTLEVKWNSWLAASRQDTIEL